jgi:hypothetical protein
MADLDELHRVLDECAALAPDPDPVAATAAARVRGRRIRRWRMAGTVAGSAVAVVAVVALGTAVLRAPGATRQLTPGGPAATATGPVRGGWPAVPGYHGPAASGGAGVPGPTQAPTAPVSGRSIDPVVPYQVSLPVGWREAGWWYQEGSFRGTWAGPDSSVEFAVIDVLDPATQPASLLHPSGDPATGSPGPDGMLAWRADARHFVRVQLQGDPPADVLASIASTIAFTPRTMIAPFRLDHLPTGLHLSGAQVRFATAETDPGGGGALTPWSVGLWFDYGTGPTRAAHDLEIGISDNIDPSWSPPIEHPTTVAGHTASTTRLPQENATLLQVFGVHGQNPYFIIGKPAQDRINTDEVTRILTGLHFVAQPEDTTGWLPIQLP